MAAHKLVILLFCCYILFTQAGRNPQYWIHKCQRRSSQTATSESPITITINLICHFSCRRKVSASNVLDDAGPDASSCHYIFLCETEQSMSGGSVIGHSVKPFAEKKDDPHWIEPSRVTVTWDKKSFHTGCIFSALLQLNPSKLQVIPAVKYCILRK